jgi:small-conductance mechanosensitive channel
MGRKFLFTVALVVIVIVVSAVLRASAARMFGGTDRERPRFWSEQIVSLAALITIVVGILAIWFDDPGRLTSALGLATAGVAVALQRVITSFAGYLIILRGNLFTVGDRIVMDTVRGDVIRLGFMQTTVMEMGQSVAESAAAPAMWVGGRQYSGRIVRITNDRIFDAPIYNYTREFPFVWEEIKIPIHHDADRAAAEKILLTIGQRHTTQVERDAKPALEKFRRMFFLPGDIETSPRVFYRLTDNWLELALRFIAPEPGVRNLKDSMYRDILTEFERQNISIASTSMEIAVPNPVSVRGTLRDERDERRP